MYMKGFMNEEKIIGCSEHHHRRLYPHVFVLSRLPFLSQQRTHFPFCNVFLPPMMITTRFYHDSFLQFCAFPCVAAITIFTVLKETMKVELSLHFLYASETYLSLQNKMIHLMVCCFDAVYVVDIKRRSINTTTTSVSLLSPFS